MPGATWLEANASYVPEDISEGMSVKDGIRSQREAIELIDGPMGGHAKNQIISRGRLKITGQS